MEDHFPTEIQGKLLWKDASIASPVQITLGDILLTPNMNEETLVVEISNQNSATQNILKIDGTFTLTPQGDYQFHGNIMPNATMDQGTISMLASIGQRNNDGSIAIRYSGKLDL